FNEHKVLLTQALKWERQQRNPSILLRGYNLRHAEAWLKVAQTRARHQPTARQTEFLQESLRQPPAPSLDVFISYSRVDSDFARQLNDRLQLQGKLTWFDQESIASGADFQQEIYRGIETSDHFLFILSPEAVNSPYCADEVEYAQKLHKRIVTVLCRPIDTSDLHPVLAAVQWIDFRKHDGDFNANFRDLLRTLETDRAHLEAHTRLLVRALEWEHKNQSKDLLLRGKQLETVIEWLTQNAEKEPRSTQL
ncbi:MAG: toll/interleukin-1 receptor domain-containing protein, partial [Cyanobacteria bacterium P01_C01_bin.120]